MSGGEADCQGQLVRPERRREKLNTGGNATDIVRTLWHGSALSVFERLSLLSFLKHGHTVEVCAYDDLEVPPGVRLCDAAEILPQSDVFSYSRGPAKGSFAAFSNLFRIKLLVEKGGIWADTDLLCLKPLHDLPEPCVGKYMDRINGAFLRFPAGHPVCWEIYHQARELGSRIWLGQKGELVTEAVMQGSTTCDILPAPAIYPVLWPDTWLLVDPEQLETCKDLTSSSYCVHWWNTAITIAMGMPKGALPPAGSYLYQQAQEVLPASDLDSWPMEIARPWIDNFKRSQELAARVKSLEPELQTALGRKL